MQGCRLFRHLQDLQEIYRSHIKYATKSFLQNANIPVPKLYKFATKKSDITLDFFASLPETFVLKPNIGSGGKDIHILEKAGEVFVEPDGSVLDLPALQHATRYLRDDTYPDLERRIGVLAEERIYPHPSFKTFTHFNTIIDFRIYFVNGNIIFAKMRIPTLKSGGYGNYTRGAHSMVVSPDGIIIKSADWNVDVPVHPDTQQSFEGFKVPMWDELLKDASKVPPLFKSPVVCVDGTFSKDNVFVVLEITLQPEMNKFSGWDYFLSLP